MIAGVLAASRQRELLLIGVLVVLVAFGLMRSSTSVANVEAGKSGEAIRADLAAMERLELQRKEINQELVNRKALWQKAESTMFDNGLAPVVIAAVSQELVGLAHAVDLQAGQPNITIDSTTSIRRVRAHLSVQGTPDAIANFLDTLGRHPTRLSTRALQLTRTNGTQASPLAWTGTIDVELLLRGARP